MPKICPKEAGVCGKFTFTICLLCSELLFYSGQAESDPTQMHNFAFLHLVIYVKKSPHHQPGHPRQPLSVEKMCPLGFEPRTFCVYSRRDNHYTMSTCYVSGCHRCYRLRTSYSPILTSVNVLLIDIAQPEGFTTVQCPDCG